MTRGVEGVPNAGQVDRLSILEGLAARGRTEPRSQDVTSFVRGKVESRSPARVIAMRMRDDGPIDGRPGVDEEAAGFAVEAAVGGAKQQRCLGVKGNRALGR